MESPLLTNYNKEQIEKNKYEIYNDFSFTLKRNFFNEDYVPASNTRTTTNFANLARGKNRKENLINTISMINNRFNSLANWDNPNNERYSVELEIISVDISIDDNKATFPSIEVLKTHIIDHVKNQRIEGIVGNNFSSYVRDYDFSILLSEHNKGKKNYSVPDDFGELHGNIFKSFVNSIAYKKNFEKTPVICLSVSSSKTYHRTENYHPILGFEYRTEKSSLTEDYFRKMGLKVRYFIPPNSVAPLAFYFSGDLLTDYTNLELISTISTMETFQKIYRPEIYNANAVAGRFYNASLKNQDYSITKIYKSILDAWSANFSL